MTNVRGPWDPDPAQPEAVPAAKPSAPARLWPWLLFLAAVGALIAALARAFPEGLQSGEDWADMGYGLGFILLISAGLVRARRAHIGQYIRHGAIWVAIVAVLALGAAYRDELAGIPRRLQMAFGVGTPIATAEHELVIPQNDDGSFVVIAQVNGQRVRFFLDTGATETVLSPADARRLGVDVDNLKYGHETETANGTGYGAAYTAQTLEVGQIRLQNFKMIVNKAPMSGSLLGMTFLSKLESFQVRGRTLILRWRE